MGPVEIGAVASGESSGARSPSLVAHAKASAAPGLGGAPLNMPIEVRQVMSAPAAEA